MDGERIDNGFLNSRPNSGFNLFTSFGGIFSGEGFDNLHITYSCIHITVDSNKAGNDSKGEIR